MAILASGQRLPWHSDWLFFTVHYSCFHLLQTPCVCVQEIFFYQELVLFLEKRLRHWGGNREVFAAPKGGPQHLGKHTWNVVSVSKETTLQVGHCESPPGNKWGTTENKHQCIYLPTRIHHHYHVISGPTLSPLQRLPTSSEPTEPALVALTLPPLWVQILHHVSELGVFIWTTVWVTAFQRSVSCLKSSLNSLSGLVKPVTKSSGNVWTWRDPVNCSVIHINIVNPLTVINDSINNTQFECYNNIKWHLYGTFQGLSCIVSDPHSHPLLALYWMRKISSQKL